MTTPPQGGRPSRSASSFWQTVCLVHVGLLVTFAAWAYGGNIWWARTSLSVVGSFSLAITIGICFQGGAPTREARRLAWALLPFALLGLIVIASCFNPSFISISTEDGARLAHTGPLYSWLPSTAEPSKTARELWFIATAYLSCFNIMLTVVDRAKLRHLLTFIALNVFALAVFGSLQRLAHAGYYFGGAVSPNPRFFATFIYYNHWGAFAVLGAGMAIGLTFNYIERVRARSIWYSAAPSAVVLTLLIVASAPLSTSRAATLMMSVLVLAALITAFRLIRRSGSGDGSPYRWLALLAAAVIALGAIGWISQDGLQQRLVQTQAQIESRTLLDDRMALYRDTWALAQRQPWFGWGLESYGTAFFLERPRPLQASRQYESIYVEAHSDWLQAFAEIGYIGTMFAILCAVVPFMLAVKPKGRWSLAGWLLGACLIVVAYAAVEFPFANAAVFLLFWLMFFAAIRYRSLHPSTAPSA